VGITGKMEVLKYVINARNEYYATKWNHATVAQGSAQTDARIVKRSGCFAAETGARGS
jgi:hypothetical protein